MREHKISGLPVTDGGSVVGILTRRDLRFVESRDTEVREVMTHGTLVTAPPGTTLEQARSILQRNKVEKLLLIHEDGRLAGLITIKDIDGLEEFPSAARDARRPTCRRCGSRRPRPRTRGAPGGCRLRRAGGGHRPRPLQERARHRARHQG